MSTDSVSFSSEAFTPDRLVAGDAIGLISKKVTIASSAALVRGAVLGKITASGKYLLSASAAADGSQTPDAILAVDADASGGDVEAMVYIAGVFNQSALTLGTGHTVGSIADGLRDKNIYLVDTQGA